LGKNVVELSPAPPNTRKRKKQKKKKKQIKVWTRGGKKKNEPVVGKDSKRGGIWGHCHPA